jgi:hypothetical protein
LDHAAQFLRGEHVVHVGDAVVREFGPFRLELLRGAGITETTAMSSRRMPRAPERYSFEREPNICCGERHVESWLTNSG